LREQKSDLYIIGIKSIAVNQTSDLDQYYKLVEILVAKRARITMNIKLTSIFRSQTFCGVIAYFLDQFLDSIHRLRIIIYRDFISSLNT